MKALIIFTTIITINIESNYAEKVYNIKPKDLIQTMLMNPTLQELKIIINFYKQDINYTNEYNETPLMFASYTKNFNIVEFLLEKGARVNATNKLGETPLMFALAQKNNLKIINLFLKHGAQVNVTDNLNRSPLTISILNQSPKAIETILKNSTKTIIDYKATVEALICRSDNKKEEKNIKKIINLIIKYTNKDIKFYEKLIENSDSEYEQGKSLCKQVIQIIRQENTKKECCNIM